MIDVHAHILPGVDDGPEDMESAMAMVRIAANGGIHTIYCTSHINTEDDLEKEFDYRRAVRESLQQAIDAENLHVVLKHGAEWMLSAEIPDCLAMYPQGCLGDSNAFLFELSRFSTPNFLPQFIDLAFAMDYRPLFAHPERYPYIGEDNFEAILAPLVRRGVLLQITSGSLTGLFGNRPKKLGEAIVKTFPKSIIIASDAHDPDIRIPALLEGYMELDSMIAEAAVAAKARLNAFLN